MKKFLIVAAFAALPACNASKPTNAIPASNQVRVAFVTNNPDPFWNIVEAGCNKASDETGIDVVFRKPPTGDPAAQKEVIDSLINSGIKAISVSVIDPKNQTAYLDEVAAKVPFIAVDNDAPASKRICYIGTNNYAAGRAVGQLVKEALPDGGSVALFVGQLEALNARQRCKGVLDELAGAAQLPDPNNMPPLPTAAETFGKYKLLKIFTDQPEGETKAVQNATDALIQLKDEPNVCMIGLWAYNPPTILTAVTDQKRLGKVKIVGFDERDATLRGIDEGHIVGTVVQDPYKFGYDSVKVMAGLAKGETFKGEKVRDVPHRTITKAGGKGRLTVTEFRLDHALKVGKGSR